MKSRAKTVVAALLAACMFALCGISALAEPEGGWVLFSSDLQDGTVILIPAEATDSEKAAAELLKDSLGKILGINVSVVTEVPTVVDGIYAVSLRVSEDVGNGRKGSYALRADEEGFTFYIEGADARGLFNGVYGFLRKFCGVEVYSADVSVFPAAEIVTVPSPYDYVYIPPLEYADTDWISPHDLDFSLANGLNGTYSPIDALHGGKINYIWFCHSLTNGIVPESELFESHPEYFALTESGEREATQLCLSNPHVVERAIQDVKNTLAEKYDPDAALNIVSVTQDDNQRYCLCDNCTALAEQYGGQSGLMIWFVNQIADAVAPEYPDAVIDTFAYQYTRHAPTGIAPRDNVCVRLCSIECCFAHALNDPACADNAQFMQDLSDWSKISSRLYVWDYVTNFLQTLGVFPNFGVLRQNIETFRENNVVGIYEEGAYYGASCNVEFFDLRAYLLSCIMRDEGVTDGDVAEWTRGFLNASLGNEKAAANVEEILQMLTEHAGSEEGHLHIYDQMKTTLHGLTAADIDHINGLWDEAEALTEGDAHTRVRRMRFAWRYYEACVGTGEFETFLSLPNIKEMQKLVDDIGELGITQYSEGRSIADVSPSALFSPDSWNGGDYATYITAYVIAGAILLLALVTVIALFVKKHPAAAVILLVLSAVSAPLAVIASKLFIEWDRLGLYVIADAALLLTVAGFCMIAAWALCGFAFPKGKRLVASILISLTAAALPYEVVILIINTLIHHGTRPTYSITVSAFALMAVVAAALIITLASLRKKSKPAK